MRPNNEPIFAQILRKWQTHCSNYDIKFQTHTCVCECGRLCVCESGVCVSLVCVPIQMPSLSCSSSFTWQVPGMPERLLLPMLLLLLLHYPYYSFRAPTTACSSCSRSRSVYSAGCCVIVSILIYVRPPALAQYCCPALSLARLQF